MRCREGDRHDARGCEGVPVCETGANINGGAIRVQNDIVLSLLQLCSDTPLPL